MSSGGQSHVLLAAACAAAALAVYTSVDSNSRRQSLVGQQQDLEEDTCEEDDAAADARPDGVSKATTTEGTGQVSAQQQQSSLEQQQDPQQHVQQQQQCNVKLIGADPWWSHDFLGFQRACRSPEPGSSTQRWEQRFLTMLPAAAAAVSMAHTSAKQPPTLLQQTVVSTAGAASAVATATDMQQTEQVKPNRKRRPRPSAVAEGQEVLQAEGWHRVQHQQRPDEQHETAAEQQQKLSWPQYKSHEKQQRVNEQQQPHAQCQQTAEAQQKQDEQNADQRWQQPREQQHPDEQQQARCEHQQHVLPELSVEGHALQQDPLLQDSGRHWSTVDADLHQHSNSNTSSAGEHAQDIAVQDSVDYVVRSIRSSTPTLPQPPPPRSSSRLISGKQLIQSAVALVDQEVQADSQVLTDTAEACVQTVQQQEPQSNTAALASQQQVWKLSQELLRAEQLSEALQQQCRSLAQELHLLQQRDAAAKEMSKQLQVRHDEQLKRLMQAHQEVEQQRVQHASCQSIAVQRLQTLLVQLQLEGSTCSQQCQQGVGDSQAVVQDPRGEQAATSLALSSHSSSMQPQHALDVLIDQLEVQLLQFIESNEAAVAPLQGLQEQVQQRTAELHAAAKALTAAASEKQVLLKAKEDLQRKLSDTQRELAARVKDLAAVTNDRMALAAAKTQLHHHVQALKEQQTVLEAAVSKGNQAAESNGKKAEQLQQALTTAQAALEAAQAAKQQVVQLQQQLKDAQYQLSLVQSERDNGLHHVADLQLQLQSSRAESSERLQQVQEFESQLQKAAGQTALLQQQLKDAAAARDDRLKQIDQLQQQARTTAEKASSLQKQLAILQAEREDSVHEVLLLQQQLQQAMDDAASSRQELSQLQKQLQEASDQVKQLQQQLAAARQQASDAQQAHAANRTETADLQAQANKLQQQAATWQAERDAAHGLKAVMQQERDGAVDKVRALEQQVAELKQQHAAAEACAIELHMKLQESSSKHQKAEEQLAAMQEEADLESSQLIEALGAAQARITGSTQQVVEAQHDVTQLAQVVELQQQQLTWQQDQMRRLRAFITHSPLRLQVPEDLLAESSTATSPEPSPQLSPSRRSAANSRVPTPVAYQPADMGRQAANTSTIRSHSGMSPRNSHRRLADLQLPPEVAGPLSPAPGSPLPAGLAQNASLASIGSDKVPMTPVEESSHELDRVKSIDSRVPTRIPSFNHTNANNASKRPAYTAAAQTSSNGMHATASTALNAHGTDKGRQNAAVTANRNRNSSNKLLQESLVQGMSRVPVMPGMIIQQGSDSSKGSSPSVGLWLRESTADDRCSDSSSEEAHTSWLWSPHRHTQQGVTNGNTGINAWLANGQAKGARDLQGLTGHTKTSTNSVK